MKKKIFLVLLLLLAVVMLVGCSSLSTDQTVGERVEPKQAGQDAAGQRPKDDAAGDNTGQIKIHFIDVGQGDSILVQLPNNQNMLIDAGPNDAGPLVAAYIKEQGVRRLDYIVATHPHADHIGGMDAVIEAFSAGRIYAPRVTANTRAFEDFLLSVKAKGLKITPARGPMSVISDSAHKLVVSFVAPQNDSYEEMNDYSVVTKIQYGQTSFLLTGDAENKSEAEMLLQSAVRLKADVLKVGHHGSSSSTSPPFLKAVSPKYAVISAGSGNDYGHPHIQTLEALEASKVKVYRTDLDGTIVAASDGENITFSTLENTVRPRAPAVNTVSPKTEAALSYIGNKSSKKFHLSSCPSLPESRNRVLLRTRDEAINSGYVPCKICNP